MRYALALIGLQALMTSAVVAQAPDPYRDVIAKELQGRAHSDYESFFDGVRVFGYAIACDVPQYRDLAYSAVRSASFEFVNKYEPFEAMQSKIKSALQDGAHKKEAQGCDFWMKNPSAVLSIREAVRRQRLP